MSIHIALHHRTHYRYDRPVTLGPQIVRLRPAPHCRTRLLSYSLRVAPDKHFINWQQDPQSNYLARLVFHEPTREFLVEVDLVAEMAVLNPFDFFLEAQAERFPFKYDTALDHELAPFLLRLPPTAEFTKYLGVLKRELLHNGNGRHEAQSERGKGLNFLTSAVIAADGRPRTIDFLVALNQRLWRDIRYLIRLEPGVQTPEETLQLASGSCRDSAWLLCQLLRHLGLASRFVSGYLVQLTADVKSLEGPRGPEKDFTDLHAWCEVYLPGAGWIGLDPTSGLLAGEGHIPLACAPDPSSAAPITGLVDECTCDFSHDMKVTRAFESSRVTKPYTQEQWREIESLGQQLDAELRLHDCRLTMGGEPTFVSMDDMDGEEWNTSALGPTKRRLADGLMKRLKRRFSTGAFLHYGQGKWYPGESLPRWALACYWRRDGQPIWLNDALFADESKSYGFDERRAEEFIYALAERLACGADWIMPAFEDTWYYLWKERRLPTNTDPFKSNLRNEEDRVRLAKIFEQGLDKIVGYALPLERHWGPGRPYWFSGPWFLRSERCYLLPGDSPMGLRLPLDSLPHVSAADFPYVHEQEPFEDRRPLPPRPQKDLQRYFSPEWFEGRGLPPGEAGGLAQSMRQQRASTQEPSPDLFRQPVRGESAAWIVRTALCVEPRQGRLHVFMPPARTLEDYLGIVAAVEDTAELLDTPVIIEGYTPPFDPRLNVIKVTPDPGVIEVNIHPAQSWDEMVRNTEVLYEEARQARLGTEKFMLDGRHTGTGGGNHIVIGGSTPAGSPLLRRPDLLRSLVAYWQNHPSLSFLFSGLFIGPTSQSPRIDEARNDSLYELEVAFHELDRQLAPHCKPSASGASPMIPPWLADRLFRNLLIDATGNTHRAEFCIDKLYSPDSASGRLGLLEMRAFEMPPHARMSLAQQLLLRTLIVKFWRQPYTNGLVRWGTDIHDRWMLPHFVWSDFADVIEDLQAGGYAMKPEWFAPHFEFRFPPFGDLEVKNLLVEIRQALEPWHVLGEEQGAGGAVRYVDSSVERVQVKARGLTDTRHVISVGGIAIPLHPTGTNGEYVAGVRYRAWQPPSCLQPTIGVHSPLVFDIVDTWNGRSVGGCTYHVAHPGGRSHSTFPVNAWEAESRRLARFFRSGHTPGPMQPRVVERNPDFPFTLDLRAV
ncbi:MAG TPA: transglutaminase family protein [Candidatus Acidoferrum sp.]|nr:transglutaminase family protein [Candidatus Acidoferrum sp.]